MNDQLRKRAEQAMAALENDVLAESFTTIDDALVGQWRMSQTREEREELYHRQHALAMVRALLLDHLHAVAVRLEKAGERGSIWRAKWNQHTYQ